MESGRARTTRLSGRARGRVAFNYGVGIVFAAMGVRAMALAIWTATGTEVVLFWVFGAVFLLFAASWVWYGEQLRRRVSQRGIGGTRAEG
jgi:hypothetical protein